MTLCDLLDRSPPGSSVHGVFQERLLELVVISYSRGSSWPRDGTCIFNIGRQTIYHCATWDAGMTDISSVQFSSVAQSCPTLCDPMNLRLKNELTNFNILLSLPNLYFCHDQQRQPHVLRARKICHSLKSLHGEKVCFGETILLLKLVTLIYLIILRKKYYRKHHKNLNIIQYPNKRVFNV